MSELANRLRQEVELIGKDESYWPDTQDVLLSAAEELETLRAENTRLHEQQDRLVGVSQAVVDRWHTPLWKDAPATAGYINALSAILAEIREKS